MWATSVQTKDNKGRGSNSFFTSELFTLSSYPTHDLYTVVARVFHQVFTLLNRVVHILHSTSSNSSFIYKQV